MYWIEQAKQRGMGGVLLSVLDMLEPFAPLIGQSLFVAAPLAIPFGGRRSLEELGHLLDDPKGLSTLRAYLDDSPHG